jgi:two-component system, LuxR family, response regulator FixJ
VVSAAGPVVRVVDDDRSFLVSVERLLRAAGYTVKSFSSAREFLGDGSSAPGCVIADLRMPGMDGLELQQALSRDTNVLPVVFLTGEGDIQTTVQAMRGGAEDFLTKTAPKEALFEAIERALARDSRQRRERDAARALRARFATLTSRDVEVLRRVVDGRLNKQIAGELGISERTVKLHRTTITTKLQVRSVAELTKLVQAAALFDESPPPLPKG